MVDVGDSATLCEAALERHLGSLDSLGSCVKRSSTKSTTTTENDEPWPAEDTTLSLEALDCNGDAGIQAGDSLIIFDWDDTLCPTTHFTESPDSHQSQAEEFEEHAKAVRDLLTVAAGYGRVAILTMAQTGWIEETTRKYMPSLEGFIEEMQIPVALAREGVTTRCRRQAFADCRDPSHFLKRRAMSKVVRDMPRSQELPREEAGSAPRHEGWRQIVSIGDSAAERNALQDLMMGRSPFNRSGDWMGCLCKTVKFKTEPTLPELTAEIRVLSQWLPAILGHQHDLDIALWEDDDASE